MSDWCSLVSLFFSFFVSLVNSVWPKLQDVWWISYAKTSPPSLDKTQCNGHSATISFPSRRLSSPPPPFPLLRSATPCTAPPKVTSVTGRVRFLLLFLPMKCFVPEVLITCLQKEKQKKTNKKNHIATDSYAPYRNRRFLIVSHFPGNSESPRRSNRKSCSHH